MQVTTPLEIFQDEGVTIVVLGTEYEDCDNITLEQLTQQLLEIAKTAEPPLVIIDLSRIGFFGSALLGAVFRGWNRVMSRADGRFAICGLTSHCADVFETTQLDRFWQVFHSRQDAIRTLTGKP